MAGVHIIMAGRLESVFNHVVLPPKLPGRRDDGIERLERDILSRLINACDSLGTLPGQGAEEAWHSVRRQLAVCLDLHHASFDSESLISAFSNLLVSDDCPVTVHIAEQNCAITIRRYVAQWFLEKRDLVSDAGSE